MTNPCTNLPSPRLKIKKSPLILLQILTLLMISASLCRAEQTLTIAGTGDSEKLLQILGKAFEKNHPGMNIIVPPSIGSNGGIKALLAGSTDLARTARPLKKEEIKPGIVEIIFANSPIVFVVNTSVSGVVDISTADIIGIFTNKIQNWQQVGGPDHKIYPLERETDDSSRNVLLRTLPGFPQISQAKVFFTVAETVQALRSHEYTIAFLPRPEALHEDLRILTINGLSPDDAAYPFKNNFSLVAKGQPTGIAAQFIDFLFSAPAQEIIRGLGLVPIKKREMLSPQPN